MYAGSGAALMLPTVRQSRPPCHPRRLKVFRAITFSGHLSCVGARTLHGGRGLGNDTTGKGLNTDTPTARRRRSDDTAGGRKTEDTAQQRHNGSYIIAAAGEQQEE